MLFRWKEVRTWRTKAHTRARSFVYLHRSRVRVCGTFTVRVHIHISIIHTVWVFRVKWCLSSFLEKLTLQARFHGSFEPRVPLLTVSYLATIFTLLAWGQFHQSIFPHHFGLLWVQVSYFSSYYIPFLIRPLHFAGATFAKCADAQTEFAFFRCFLLFFWLAPFFSLSLSLVHIHIIYLLSSLCWVGNQSLGTQAHYPCTVSTGLWFFDCVVCTKIFIYYFECDISFHTYIFIIPAIGAVVLLYSSVYLWLA